MEKLYRIEKDFIGEKEIETNKYYGIQTLRAKENFNITKTDISLFPNFIKSLAKVKKACALTNFELGDLTDVQKDAIVQACNEIIDGKFHDQFIADPIQGGAGTSTNMNANEVIANRALEILGKAKSSYDIIHPNNHINMSQSTNDVYPTAIKLTLHELIFKLKDSLRFLRDCFEEKSIEFKDVLKMGRTQLQDAVPMTLGQEFKTFAVMLDADIFRLREAQSLLKEVNLGATAIGTGINTKASYKRKVVSNLREVTGVDYISAGDLIEATQDTGSFVQISGMLKSVAIKISKICNDLRLLSSGPRAGFNEINLPPLQPGSSIMPGKVNPVIPEAMNISCFHIMSNDLAITLAAEAGQLQLNAMEPLIAFKLFESLNLLQNAVIMFKEKCIDTVQANAEHCTTQVYQSIGIITALNPYLGYETTTRLAKAAFEEHKNILDMIRAEQLLPEQQLQEILSPRQMLHPHQSAS